MTEKKENEDCFIIMPIGDAEGYPKGHFGHVYNNIIRPACEMCGYKAMRADEVKETNLIHLDILKKLIEAPIAICDLSNRNPNVLFELGIRQAFDKPVVLIQEEGTPKIFDITPLRYLEYSNEMKYHDVLSIQQKLKDAIEATASVSGDATNINSIVKLLALNNPAQIPDLENGKESLAFEVLQAEIKHIRQMMEMTIHEGRKPNRRGSIAAIEYERIVNNLDRLIANKRISSEERIERYKQLQHEAETLMQTCNSETDHIYIDRLIKRIQMTEREIFP